MASETPLQSKDVRRAAPIPDWMQTALYRRFGVTAGWAVGNRVCARLGELLALPSPFVDAQEQAFAAREILPLVALYQTLVADGETAEAAETEVRRARGQALRDQPVRGIGLVARMPGRRYWLRRMVEHEVAAVFPTPIFKLATTQQADTLAYEVKRCPYGAALAAYGAPELMGTFCRLEEIRFERLANAVTCEHAMSAGTCRFDFHPDADKKALEEAEAYLEV